MYWVESYLLNVELKKHNAHMIEQVTLNKPSLLLKITLQNTQMLQLLTRIIKTEIIYNSN